MLNFRKVFAKVTPMVRVYKANRFNGVYQNLFKTQMCQFSGKNKYDDKFNQFMKSQTEKMTDDVKRQRELEAEEEHEKLSEQAKMQSEKAKEKLKQTKATFESFSEQKSEMKLGDVFKNIKLTEYTNEIGKMASEVTTGASKRVGGLLQMRKKLFKEKKKEAVEKIIEEEVKKMDIEGAKVDDTKDQTQTEASEKTSESDIDPTKDTSAETTEKSEKESKPKVSAVSKLKSRISQTGDTINQKAPFIYKTGVFIKDLWQETFPNDSNKVKSRIGKRREVAKMQKQYSEEELEEMQEQIPEWKRTAVTMVDEEELDKKQSGVLKRLTKKIGSKVTDTSIAKSIMESEEFKEFKKKYREIKTETSEFKEDLKEEVETAQNPVVGTARTLGDYVFKDTLLGQAVGKMVEYDPEFDVNDLHYEIEEIFTDMFDNYLEGDLEYLETFCGDAALAVIKTELQRRKKEGWEPKVKELIFCTDSNLMAGSVGEDNKPRFTFTLSAQEINCKVSTKEPEKIIEGDENDLEKAIYKITVRRHDEPDLALTGHYWEVIEFEKYEVVKQLV